MKELKQIKSLCKTSGQKAAFNKLVSTFASKPKLSEDELEYTFDDMVSDGVVDNSFAKYAKGRLGSKLTVVHTDMLDMDVTKAERALLDVCLSSDALMIPYEDGAPMAIVVNTKKLGDYFKVTK